LIKKPQSQTISQPDFCIACVCHRQKKALGFLPSALITITDYSNVKTKIDRYSVAIHHESAGTDKPRTLYFVNDFLDVD
jgi:hypothetical protein